VRHRRLSILVFSGVVGLAIAGCSSDDGSASSGSASTAPKSPCSIATVEELTQTSGVTFTAADVGTPDGPDGCWYKGPDDAALQVNIYSSRAAFDARRETQCSTSRSNDPISGLGVEASHCGPDVLALVNADRGFVIYCGDVEFGKCEDVARLMEPRVTALP